MLKTVESLPLYLQAQVKEGGHTNLAGYPTQTERLALLLNLGKKEASKLPLLIAKLQSLLRGVQSRNNEKSVDRFVQMMMEQASAQKRCNEGAICQQYTTPRGKHFLRLRIAI